MLSLVAAIVVPALGFALQASRRNRLRQRIPEYLALAKEVESHDAAAAAEFRSLAIEAAHLLAARERRWIRRTLDPAAIIAILLLLAPAVAGVILAWDWDSSWRVPAIIGAVIWGGLWTAAGLTQIFKERGDVSSEHEGRR